MAEENQLLANQVREVELQDLRPNSAAKGNAAQVVSNDLSQPYPDRSAMAGAGVSQNLLLSQGNPVQMTEMKKRPPQA